MATILSSTQGEADPFCSLFPSLSRPQWMCSPGCEMKIIDGPSLSIKVRPSLTPLCPIHRHIESHKIWQFRYIIQVKFPHNCIKAIILLFTWSVLFSPWCTYGQWCISSYRHGNERTLVSSEVTQWPKLTDIGRGRWTCVEMKTLLHVWIALFQLYIRLTFHGNMSVV